MRNELQQIEEIEQYLEGKMGNNERILFEQRMQADENLRSQVEIQDQLTQQIKIQAFRNEIFDYHNKYAEKATGKFKAGKFYLNPLLLFGVLGLVAFSVYLLLPSSEKNEVPAKVETTEILANNNTQKNLVPGTAVAAEKNPNEPAAMAQPAKRVQKKHDEDDHDVTPAPSAVEDTPCRDFQLTFHTALLDAATGGQVVTKDSKSVINFPANILMDENGNTVKGKVEIQYREYRNAAQMAFSQIPMTYHEAGKDYRFNSAGMFEIRAFQNGRELKVKPGSAFEVDFKVTSKPDSCFFFVLDDKTQVWKKVSKVNYKVKENKIGSTGNYAMANGQVFIKVVDAYTGENLSQKVFVKFINPAADLYSNNNFLDGSYNISTISRGTYDMLISSDDYKKMKLSEVKVFEGKITYITAALEPAKNVRGSSSIQDEVPKEKEQQPGFFQRIFKKKKTKSSMLSPGFTMNISNDNIVALPLSRPDIRYKHKVDFVANDSVTPNLVKGLRCASFGIYNCDQLNRLKEPMVIRARYQDPSGNDITNAYVVTVIDLQYNGAFSFSPEEFTCSRSSDNVILLFTRDKKLFSLPANQYHKMNIQSSGEYTVKMQDITGDVKDTEDLRLYLGLKKE